MAGTTVELPRGIVTFVFTDIEGSTRLLHHLGDEYPAVLERHREAIRHPFSERGGHEMSTEGDSFFFAFAEAADAVAACVEGQRALAGESWPGDIELRVRMGLHSGLASPRGESYVALAVHQAVRVMAAAHGGQILVSDVTADLLPREFEVGLRPLGRFRLRDFDEPTRLYQVLTAGLREEFPAVRAVPADAHNIVRDPRATIGREETLSAVADRIAVQRTLTLIGPGGVGKSRVAADVGVDVAPRWQDGVWLVDLAGVAEPELVPGAVAEAVGAPTRAGTNRADDVIRHLETRHAVVILDNCEHLVAACSDLIERLRVRCEGIGFLATSREPLRAAGEMLWPIEPLEVVPEGNVDPADVLDAPSSRLFWERASAVRPGFVIDEHNAGAVARLCRRLDGLPLLIELAAAQISAQSPGEILEGVEESVRMLRSPDRRIADRHRTVEGLLDWSYRLLSPTEQAAFRRVAVFGGSFTRETGSAAVTDEDIAAAEVTQLIWSLVDRSLVAADIAANGTRYRLLGTMRSYGRRLLVEHEEMGGVATDLASWFLDRLGPWLPADRKWVGEVAVELDNLRALVRLIPAERQELAQQIACTIGWHHDAISNYREGVDELTRFAGLLDRPSPARVSLLTTLTILHLRTGQVETARKVLAEAESLSRDHGPPPWDDVAVDRARGEVTRRAGDLAGAADIAYRALSRPLSDRGRSRMYNLLGTTSAALGDFETAVDACRRELELWERLGYEGYVASSHGNLAEVALRSGDMASAARHQRACLNLAVAQGSSAMVAFSMIVAARLAGTRSAWGTAVSLHSRAEDLLDEIGLVLYPDDRRESAAVMEQAEQLLGLEAFEEAREVGRRLDLTTTVELADDVLASVEAPEGSE